MIELDHVVIRSDCRDRGFREIDWLYAATEVFMLATAKHGELPINERNSEALRIVTPNHLAK